MRTVEFDRFVGIFGTGREKAARGGLIGSQRLVPANAAEHRQLWPGMGAGMGMDRVHGVGWLILASIWPIRRSTRAPSWSHVEPDAFGVTPIRYQPGRN